MSTKPNHRRQQDRIQDNGSTYEGDPNDGGRGIRRARRSWKRIGAREERRTGKRNKSFKKGLSHAPPIAPNEMKVLTCSRCLQQAVHCFCDTSS